MSAPAAGHPLHALNSPQRSAPEPLHRHKPLPAQGTQVMSACVARQRAPPFVTDVPTAHNRQPPYERHACGEAVHQQATARQDAAQQGWRVACKSLMALAPFVKDCRKVLAEKEPGRGGGPRCGSLTAPVVCSTHCRTRYWAELESHGSGRARLRHGPEDGGQPGWRAAC